MRLFPDVSIKRKQMLIIMLTSSVALLLACIGFVGYEFHTFRQDMRRNLLSIAARLADTASGLLSMEDRGAANTKLASMLATEPNIVVACLYKPNGKTIATYRRPSEIGLFNAPSAPQKTGFNFSFDRLTLAQPVRSDGVLTGTVYLESDLEVMNARLVRYGGIVLGVLLVSSIVAFVLSSRLQRVISDPIIHLAGVAKIVSQKQNYAVRAMDYQQGQTADELSALITGFNEMLAQIQNRDAQLQKARDDLEKRVEERTRDLSLEITERSRAEKALKQQFSRITLLNQIAQSIAERMDLSSVLNIVLKQLEDHLPVSFGVVLVSNSANDFALTAIRSKAPLGAEAGRFSLQTIVKLSHSGLQECTRKMTVSVPDTSQCSAPLLLLLSRVGLRSAVAVPMLVEDRLFGILLVARNDPDGFSGGECEFLRVLSEQVALAAHQARLHSELQTAYNELRQTQQAVMQQQRLQALGQMASGIAHDINNALSPIIVYSELIGRNERFLGEASRRHLTNIKTCGEDIAHIVGRMREFYRRREDNEQLTLLNLNRVAEQVIEMTRPRWRDIPQQKGIVIDMQTEFDPDVPEIYGSASELREALTNLLLNSVDALPSGGRLTVRTSVTQPGGDGRGTGHVILEVCDTGIGMDEETKRRCLEPFFSTKGLRGTGLGLAMVYGIMERHDGTIEIESTLGKGTTMRLIFPLRDLFVPENDSVESRSHKIRPLRILCIDDEPLLRQLLKEILEADGHSVITADGGQAGIDAFREAKNSEAFDMVITDLGMPYVDGRQVAGTLKRESPETPIILLTGWGAMMKGDAEGPPQVDSVLSKPPRISELRTALATLCKPKTID